MKIDLINLLVIFDEMMPTTKEDIGVYWLKFKRNDEVTITLAFSLLENYVDVIIKTNNLDITSISMNSCTEINILDEQKKCLEILNDQGRCFLSLTSSSILDYSDN